MANQKVSVTQKEIVFVIGPDVMAPDFTLESTQGRFTLSALRGEKHVVLIFYPMDNTPG